jgi:hypothetical protein
MNIARLRQQHESIQTMLDASGDQDLRLRPAPSTWSIQENIAHLYAYQQIFAGRVHRILTETNPTFAPYVGDNDPRFLTAREQPVAELLTDLSSDRLYLSDWLTSLSEAQLAMKASHSTFGTRSLSLWTEFFLLHEAHHLFTIWKLAEDRT